MRRSTPHTTSLSNPSSKAIPASKAWLTVSALTAAAATLAACGATSQYAPREGYTPPPAREPLRPNFPITQAPAAAEPLADAPTSTAPNTSGDPAPMASPSGTISSQPLPPPIQSQELPPPPPTPPPPPPQTSYVAPPAVAPATTTTTVTSVSGRVVDVAGKPQVYVIKSGDTLTSIARRMGVTQKALADLNDLEPPYALRPGRTLKGPGGAAKAYVVGAGDTLYAIARRFGVSAAAIAEANDIGVSSSIRAGQRLELPDGFRDSGPVRTTVTRAAPATPSQTLAAQAPPVSAPTISAPPASTPAAVVPAAGPQTPAAVSTEVSVSGRVVDVAGKPVSYKVRSGDTVIGLAGKLNTTQKQLIDDNDLKAPYSLRIGQTLKGPATKAKAYVVGQGDTLRGVAQRFSVTTAAVASANGLRTTSALRAGQRLTLPASYRDRGPIRTTTTTLAANSGGISPATSGVPTSPQPYSPPAARPATTPTPSAPAATPRPTPAAALPTDSPPLSDSEIAAAGQGRFTWPVRGPVISSYGPTGAGQRNDGLNLRASAGDPVRSAAAGEVVYAGDVVPGFGNLVLIKHDGGWVTAYGHLSRSDVRMQQQVAQGQQIGQVGASGGASEPQLHFEVRYAPSAKDRARPIDPALVLPR